MDHNGKMTLLDLQTGVTARIIKVGGQGAIRQRLLDMGVIKGTVFSVERYAPMGDPVEISIKGYLLAIRKDEARNIIVELEKGI